MPVSSREKFVELAEKRVTRALRDIKLVGNLANKGSYEYTDQDADKIVRTLKKAVDELKTKFEHSGADSDIMFKL